MIHVFSETKGRRQTQVTSSMSFHRLLKTGWEANALTGGILAAVSNISGKLENKPKLKMYEFHLIFRRISPPIININSM